MIVSGPQRGGFEQIFANFYLMYNEWGIYDWGVAKANTQMRGFSCFLVLDQADLNSHATGTVYPGAISGGFVNYTVTHDSSGMELGKAVFVAGSGPGSGGFDNKQVALVGAIESSFVCGVDEIGNARWVTIQLYGIHRALAASASSFTATDEVLLAAGGTCEFASMSKEKAEGTMGLFGTVTIPSTPAVVDLSAASGISWTVHPSVNRIQRWGQTPGAAEITTGGFPVPGRYAIAGYNIRNTTSIDDFGTRRTNGFLSCLGANVGRFS